MTFIPWNNKKKAESFPPRSPLSSYNINKIIPEDPVKPYNVRDIIKSLCDSNFFEVQEHLALNIVIGFSRFSGEAVGIIANQPLVLAGCLDIDPLIRQPDL